MRLLALLLIVAAATAAPNPAAAAPNPATNVLGNWKTTTGSIVSIEPCGANTCLKIVQLSPSSAETSDSHNPDAALRSRSLCGLIIGTGFHEDNPGHLSDGNLYDPKSGHTYKGTIQVEGADLKLHGYIGISLFGRTEIWHRAAAVTACR